MEQLATRHGGLKGHKPREFGETLWEYLTVAEDKPEPPPIRPVREVAVRNE